MRVSRFRGAGARVFGSRDLDYWGLRLRISDPGT